MSRTEQYIKQLRETAPEGIRQNIESVMDSSDLVCYIAIREDSDGTISYYSAPNKAQILEWYQTGHLNELSIYWKETSTGIKRWGNIRQLARSQSTKNSRENKPSAARQIPANELTALRKLGHEMSSNLRCVYCGCSRSAILDQSWVCDKAPNKDKGGDTWRILGYTFATIALCGVGVLFFSGLSGMIGTLLDDEDSFAIIVALLVSVPIIGFILFFVLYDNTPTYSSSSRSYNTQTNTNYRNLRSASAVMGVQQRNQIKDELSEINEKLDDGFDTF